MCLASVQSLSHHAPVKTQKLPQPEAKVTNIFAPGFSYLIICLTVILNHVPPNRELNLLELLLGFLHTH